MSDRQANVVTSASAATGPQGQKYLAAGESVALRLWEKQPAPDSDGDDGGKGASQRDYETVGYVLKGRAELQLDDRVVELKPGDSWVVPKGAIHTYRVLEPFTAVEATHPPAREDNRDGV